MERYRKSVKKRVIIYGVITVIMLALCIYSFMAARHYTNDNTKDFIEGFRGGACAGVFGVMLFSFIQSMVILRDDKKLQLTYNKEHDERMRAIRAKSGYPVATIMSIIMIIAGIIASPFSDVVFFTAVACGVGQVLVSLAMKIIYTKIM